MIPAECIFNLNDHRSKQKKNEKKTFKSVYILKKCNFYVKPE